MSPLVLALLALLGTATGHTPSRRELIARRAEATTTIKPKVDTDEGDSDEGTPTTTAVPDMEQSSGASTDDVEVESHTTSAPETEGSNTNEDRQGFMLMKDDTGNKGMLAMGGAMRRRKLDTPGKEDSADGSPPDQSTGQEDSSSGTSDTNAEQSHQSEPDKSDASETTTIAPTTETTTTDV